MSDVKAVIVTYVYDPRGCVQYNISPDGTVTEVNRQTRNDFLGYPVNMTYDKGSLIQEPVVETPEFESPSAIGDQESNQQFDVEKENQGE